MKQRKFFGKFSASTLKTLVCCILVGALLPLGNACSRMQSAKVLSTDLGSSGGVATGIPGINDHYFPHQWTLKNTGQNGGAQGEDINVVPAWLNGNFGQDVLVAVVDDGLEITHPDIAANVKPGLSFNYVTGQQDPGGPDAFHGTSVGGIIAAQAGNGFGIAGIAHRAQIIGYNFLKSDTDATQVDAMTRNKDTVGVSNCSWGPEPLGYGVFRPTTSSFIEGIETGVQTGRGGKGTVFVFAAGNGAVSLTGDPADTANMNGYANYHGVMAVCAVDHRGLVAFYSEPGANLWVCAPSWSGVEHEPGVYTTDLVGGLYGFNTSDNARDLLDRSYTSQFSGTSAAAPVVSGIAALILGKRPELSWRDVKWILARSARKNHAASPHWAKNGAETPFNIHYDYGFGVADAGVAVELAKTWIPVGPQKIHEVPTVDANIAIDDAGTIVSSPTTVIGSGISRLEFVEITVNLTHADWGNLIIQIERSGNYPTISRLTVNHKCFGNSNQEVDCLVDSNTFRFGTARHLGEAGDGEWKLRIVDGDAANGKIDGKSGTLTSWSMRLFGE